MSQINSLNDEQFLAVHERDKNILVSAPAGSGKTKILVSRIISLIVEDRYHIDEFLVLTFTQAAATEMKQRLVVALEKEMENASGELLQHLERQKEKLPFAYITNFHGFCNQLLNQYGYLIGINPGYNIISETNALKDETLEELFQEMISQPSFIEFQNLYFSRGDLNELKKLLLDLMQVMSAMSDKKSFVDWVITSVYGFMESTNENISEWTIFSKIKQQLEETCIIGINKIYELKQFSEENDITPFYERPLSKPENPKKPSKIPMESLLNYYQSILQTLQQESVSFKGSGGINEISKQTIEKSYLIPWKELSDKANEAKSKFTTLRSEINGLYKNKYQQIIETDVTERKLIFTKIREVINFIMGEEGLLIKFFDRYKKNKQVMNVLDFNDLEEYTIKLLQPKHQVSELLHSKLKEIMVDEYQDTNMIQETIVSMIAQYKEPFVHYFMVGDMKQSIYRFRQADPEIFKKKYDLYGVRDNDSKKIELLFNYRSNKIVLDSINYIFNQIMDSHIGQLEYYHDKSAQLNYDFLRKEGAKDIREEETITKKASQRIEKEEHLSTEILLLDKSSKDSEEVIDDIEYEAHMIALRIKEMIEEPLMINAYPEGLRPIDYSDIVVLMRATTSFLTFKKVFDKHHIPNHIVLSQGFIQSVEVVNIFSLIKAIKNRYDDVSLLAVLRAPFMFSYFKDIEIADIRLHKKEGSIYDCLINYKEGNLYEKIQIFLNVFNDLVDSSVKIPFKEWFKNMYEITGYPYFVANQINGEQRYANLSLLLENVMQEEQPLSFHEWADIFIQWQTHGEHNMPAMVQSSSSSQVSFMTIHKSKGLEFPIVIVASHQKKFNMQDGSARLIVDKNYGMTIKPRVYQNIPMDMMGEQLELKNVVVEYENPYLKVLSNLANQETISEEMRIYYVALTRASQKLILTGVMDKESIINWQTTVLANEENMPESSESDHIIFYRNARNVKSYLDWLGISLMRHPQILKQLKDKEYDINQYMDINFKDRVYEYCEKIERMGYDKRYQLNNIRHSKFRLAMFNYQYIDEKLEIRTTYKENKKLTFDSKKVDYYLNYQYPSKMVDTAKSIAVTKIHNEVKEEKQKIIEFKEYDQQQELTPSEKGTLIHAFMEFLPFDEMVSIEEVIETLYQKGLYNDKELQVLLSYKDKFQEFRNTDLFKIMVEAPILLKEKSFSYFDKELNQVVHGVFDALCIYPDQVIVIDYKSDRVSKQSKNEELVNRHAKQLNYYQNVLKEIYPDNKVVGYIVYLEINRVVKIPMEKENKI